MQISLLNQRWMLFQKAMSSKAIWPLLASTYGIICGTCALVREKAWLPNILLFLLLYECFRIRMKYHTIAKHRVHIHYRWFHQLSTFQGIAIACSTETINCYLWIRVPFFLFFYHRTQWGLDTISEVKSTLHTHNCYPAKSTLNQPSNWSMENCLERGRERIFTNV